MPAALRHFHIITTDGRLVDVDAVRFVRDELHGVTFYGADDEPVAPPSRGRDWLAFYETRGGVTVAEHENRA